MAAGQAPCDPPARQAVGRTHGCERSFPRGGSRARHRRTARQTPSLHGREVQVRSSLPGARNERKHVLHATRRGARGSARPALCGEMGRAPREQRRRVTRAPSAIRGQGWPSARRGSRATPDTGEPVRRSSSRDGEGGRDEALALATLRAVARSKKAPSAARAQAARSILETLGKLGKHAQPRDTGDALASALTLAALDARIAALERDTSGPTDTGRTDTGHTDTD